MGDIQINAKIRKIKYERKAIKEYPRGVKARSKTRDQDICRDLECLAVYLGSGVEVEAALKMKNNGAARYARTRDIALHVTS